MALAGPSRFCKAVASLGILQRGSVLPQIPVSYCLSFCSGGNRRLYRKAALAGSSTLTPHTGIHTLQWEEGRLSGAESPALAPKAPQLDADFHSSSLEDVMGLFLSLRIPPCSFCHREKSCHFNLRHNSEEFSLNFLILSQCPCHSKDSTWWGPVSQPPVVGDSFLPFKVGCRYDFL